LLCFQYQKHEETPVLNCFKVQILKDLYEQLPAGPPASPLSLTQLCRAAVHHSLRLPFTGSLAKLPLPDPVRAILYSQIDLENLKQQYLVVGRRIDRAQPYF
jgi:hypothetical protein